MKTINVVKGIALLTALSATSLFAQQKSIEVPKTSTSKLKTLQPNYTVNNNTNRALCAVAIDCSDNDAILNVTYSTINNTTTCSPNGYGDFQIITANITAGQATPISVTVGDGWSTESVGMWVDYNGDENFTEDEFIYIGVGSGNTITSSVTIPANTPGGIYAMRFMVYAGGITADLGCYNEPLDYGEFEDYTLNLTAAPPCNILPGTITLASTATSICDGESIQLSMNYTPDASGLTYQLQSSTDGTTWSNIQTPTAGNTFITSPTQNTQYRTVLTCSVNGQSVTSNVVSVTLKTPLECLCTPILDCTDGDLITNVSLPSVSFSNASTCGTDGYTDYASLTIPNLGIGTLVPVQVTVGSGFTNESVSLWIDYNDNGVFETSEFTYIGTGSGSVVSDTLSISPTATLGTHLMRIRVAAVGQAGATGDMACNETQTYGETEDYRVTIVSNAGIETSELQNISVFPNPTKGNVVISSIPTESVINIIDFTGRSVYSINAQANMQTNIDMSSLAAGVYHVSISNATGTSVKKVVKN